MKVGISGLPSVFTVLIIHLSIVAAILTPVNVTGQTNHAFREIGPGDIRVGAERFSEYLDKLHGKSVALVANQTSLVSGTHLADTLLSLGIGLERVFCPEHGFRGDAGAGEIIIDGKDSQTGLPVISLYGSNKKPRPEDLQDIDIVLFDIQDVGVRFYTYVSTMTYVMEACAEQSIPVIILDRPDPNGHYVDGPVLKPEYRSFVGLHPVPVVHGMTLGEYARMVNGEGWLAQGIQCDLEVVSVAGYSHREMYELPVRPSPNLPNMSSVYLYPSLAFFEGTIISVARGTDFPFQAFGHPDLDNTSFEFTPEKRIGAAPNPPYEGIRCHGYDLRDFGNRFIRNYRKLYIYWLTETYNRLGHPEEYFNAYFDKLAGSDELRKQIVEGLSEKQIRDSWQDDLKKFKDIRKKYLLYPDFE